MLFLSKDEAKTIRKLNKEKGRPENAGMIYNGSGKTTVMEYYKFSNYDFSIQNYVSDLKQLDKKSNEFNTLSKKISFKLKEANNALLLDLKELECLIDIYTALWENFKIEEIKTFQKQLSDRQRRYKQYLGMKNEFEKIIKGEEK